MKYKSVLLGVLFSVSILFAQNPGKISLQFDGANDYVNCGNDESIQITGTQITIEVRIRVDEFKEAVWQGNIISKEHSQSGNDTGYMLRCGKNGTLNFVLGDGSWHELSSSEGVVQLNIWHHVACTYDGINMRIYVDGSEVANKTDNINIGNTPVDKNLLVGDSPSYPGRVFSGQIDEVRLWEVSRTQKQLQSTMNDTLTSEYYSTADSGLVGYWRFEENIGQTTVDLTINGNEGLLGSTEDIDINDPVWINAVHPPTLVNPSNYSAVLGNPTFEWNPGYDVQTYHLQVASDLEFINLMWDNDAIPGTQTSIVYSGITLSSGVEYFWRVSYITNDTEFSDWSEIWRFTYLDVYSGATLIDESFDSEIVNFTLNGDAILDQNSIRLTLNQGNQGGSIFFNDAMSLSDFEVTFDAYFGSNTGGADGICFVWQTNSTDVIGELGGGMAYKNIDNSYAVEFDTYYNSQFSDPDDNHIGVDQNGSVVSVTDNTNIITLEDDSWHNIRIRQDNGHIYVWLDDESYINYAFPNYISDSNYYYGFTGATGNANNIQRIDNYLLKGNYVSGVQDGSLYSKQIPDVYRIEQNYPNPFNPTTKIRFGLPIASKVKLDIHNTLGQRVSSLLNRQMMAGFHTVEFNASHFGSGIYFCHFHADNYQKVIKMILIQ